MPSLLGRPMTCPRLLPVAVAVALAAPCSRNEPAPPSRPAELGQLSRAALGAGTDKGFPGHWYTENYERFLWHLKNEPIRIFEIGIAGGGSLRLWQAYFPRATLYGIDIKDGTKFENERVKTCVADQAKRDQLKQCLDRFGGQFDLMIDDGGHGMEMQQVSLGFLFPYLKPGGFYAIEDLHTSMPRIYKGFDVEPGEGNSTLNLVLGYVKSAPGKFTSKYMLPSELAYLDQHVESADLHFANNQGHSMMCIFKKRGPWPVPPAQPVPSSPGETATRTVSSFMESTATRVVY